MRLQGERQTIGFFAFVDVQCEDNCPNKCYEGKMSGTFCIDAFGKMDLRLRYTGTGFCINLLGAKQATGQLGGFRMHGCLHAPLSVRKPSFGVANYVTLDDCGITKLPSIGSVTEITISVGYAIEREQIDGDISFSEFKVGLDGLLQWVRVNSIDVHLDIHGQGNWKIGPKYADPISHQFEDFRIEFVPTIWGDPVAVAAIPEKYTVRQGMSLRFAYSHNVPLKTLVESLLEFQNFLSFALNRPVMVRSAEGSYPEDDSNNPALPVYFPSRQQPEIDITGIYRGDRRSLFVYDQIGDFAKTFAAWRKLRSEVGDPFFGSVMDMYLECLYGSRLPQDMLVDYLKIIELMQRQFKRTSESELRQQWNWGLGRFPQEKDLMVAPYWDKFFLSSLKEIGYASTPKEFGETARTLRDAVVHPVGATEKLKEIGINEGDKRALRAYVIKYAMMYERLVQLYLVTFLGLDPIKLADDGNLFASRVLGPSLIIGDIKVN